MTRLEKWVYQGKKKDGTLSVRIVISNEQEASKPKYTWGVSVDGSYLTDRDFGALLIARAMCDEFRWPQPGYKGCQMTAMFYRLIAEYLGENNELPSPRELEKVIDDLYTRAVDLVLEG